MDFRIVDTKSMEKNTLRGIFSLMVGAGNGEKMLPPQV
jgi:hypothetical protein